MESASALSFPYIIPFTDSLESAVSRRKEMYMRQVFGDVRRHERRRFRGAVAISWVNATGSTCRVLGNCLDISLYGMLVEMPEPIPTDTEVMVRVSGIATPKAATVRHWRQCAGWFRIGLQSREPLLT